MSADPGAPDPLLTGAAVLTLLSDLSGRGPVLVVADDAHWLDRSSLDALAFAGSRLDAEPVVLLVGARGDAPPSGFDRGFPELHLEPLPADDAGRLLDGQPRPPRGRARGQVRRVPLGALGRGGRGAPPARRGPARPASPAGLAPGRRGPAP